MFLIIFNEIREVKKTLLLFFVLGCVIAAQAQPPKGYNNEQRHCLFDYLAQKLGSSQQRSCSDFYYVRQPVPGRFTSGGGVSFSTVYNPHLAAGLYIDFTSTRRVNFPEFASAEPLYQAFGMGLRAEIPINSLQSFCTVSVPLQFGIFISSYQDDSIGWRTYDKYGSHFQPVTLTGGNFLTGEAGLQLWFKASKVVRIGVNGGYRYASGSGPEKSSDLTGLMLRGTVRVFFDQEDDYDERIHLSSQQYADPLFFLFDMNYLPLPTSYGTIDGFGLNLKIGMSNHYTTGIAITAGEITPGMKSQPYDVRMVTVGWLNEYDSKLTKRLNFALTNTVNWGGTEAFDYTDTFLSHRFGTHVEPTRVSHSNYFVTDLMASGYVNVLRHFDVGAGIGYRLSVGGPSSPQWSGLLYSFNTRIRCMGL